MCHLCFRLVCVDGISHYEYKLERVLAGSDSVFVPCSRVTGRSVKLWESSARATAVHDGRDVCFHVSFPGNSHGRFSQGKPCTRAGLVFGGFKGWPGAGWESAWNGKLPFPEEFDLTAGLNCNQLLKFNQNYLWVLHLPHCFSLFNSFTSLFSRRFPYLFCHVK